MNTEKIFDSKGYKVSRIAYTAQSAIEYFIALLIADAFLAKLLKAIGLSDAVIGTISSLVTFSYLFQILSIILMQKIKNIKKTVVFADTVGMLFLTANYLIPFLPISQTFRTILVFVFVGGGYAAKYIVASVFFKWANSFVHPTKRASFSAVKEMISLVTGIAFTLTVGFVVDGFEADNNITGCFIFLGITMLVLSLINFFTILKINNISNEETKKQGKSLKEVFQLTFGNKGYRRILLMEAMYAIGRYATIGFLGTYKTSDLALSVGLIQVINMVGCGFRFILSKPIGRYSDKTSFANGYCLGILFACIGFICIVFTTPKTWWLIFGYTVFYYISLAGTNQNGLNMAYNYVPADCFIQASAIKSSVCGILGFLSSVVASKILAAVQENGNVVFGIEGIYGQQVLGLISFIIFVGTFFYIRFVVEKQEVLKQ